MSVVVLTVAAWAGAAEGGRDLLAHGSEEMFWIARVSETEELDQVVWRTTIRARGGEDGPRWRRFARVGARVTDLSNRGSQLIVLMESGTWRFIWADGSSPGPALRNGGRIVRIASDDSSIWAVALLPEMPPGEAEEAAAGDAVDVDVEADVDETADADEEAADVDDEIDSPAIEAPGSGRLHLYSLERTTWASHGALPESIEPADVATMSLAVVEGRPMLAVQRGGRIEMHCFTDGETWSDCGTIEADFDVADFRLLSHGTMLPTLWVAPAIGAGAIYRHRDGWQGPVELEIAGEFEPAEATERAFGVASQRLRLVLAIEEELFEQTYALDGSPVGEIAPLTPPPRDIDPGVMRWINLAVMAALLLVILGTLRRRKNLQQSMQQVSRVGLAGFGSRLLAGMIDALPLLVISVAMALRAGDPEVLAEHLLEPENQWLVGAATIAYLLHTMLAELLTGRSLGKMFFGLRVVSLDGRPATAGAIVMRNLLRVVDLWGMLFPLALVLFSPLRQRVGDIPAGTMVVGRDFKAPDRRQDEESDKYEEVNSDRPDR